MKIPQTHLAVLHKLHAALEDSTVTWAVTGSLGMALQGMELTVHDIDIQTDEDGAYEIERRLAEHVVKPILYKRSERIRSRLGILGIDGVTVEVMGVIQKRLPEGEWESPVSVSDHQVWVEVDGLRVPVLDLEYEAEAYRHMGRPERAAQIDAWLANRKER